MKTTARVLVVLTAVLMHTAAVAQPKQFSTPEAMAELTGDFSVEDGTFKVLKRKPLHLQLTIAPSDPSLAGEAMFRAFLWGVYRTLLHTNAQSVQVTVVSPVAAGGHTTFTEGASRTHALRVARELLGVSDLAGLLTERQTWTDAMKRCIYSDQGKPGLRVCALAVAGRT